MNNEYLRESINQLILNMNKMGMYSVRPCGVCGCVVTYFFGEMISGIAYR